MPGGEKIKVKKFEDAVKRLEEIVEELETGDFDLDKSVEIFEEGLQLTKFCKTRLDEAEKKIEVIKKQSGKEGGYKTEEMDISEIMDKDE